MEIIFHSHANKTYFHKKSCAPSLILKVRVFGTRKWPVSVSSLDRAAKKKKKSAFQNLPSQIRQSTSVAFTKKTAEKNGHLLEISYIIGLISGSFKVL